jgi:GT2 family glycosyltransferase
LRDRAKNDARSLAGFSPAFYIVRNSSKSSRFAKTFFRFVFANRLMLFILNNRRLLANLYCRRKAPFFLFFLIFLVFRFLKILRALPILPQQCYFIVESSLAGRRATPTAPRF